MTRTSRTRSAARVATRATESSSQATSRPNLARRTKPTNLYVGDSDESSGASDADASIASEPDETSDEDIREADGRGLADDLDIHPPGPTTARGVKRAPGKSLRSATQSRPKSSKATRRSTSRAAPRGGQASTPTKTKRPRPGSTGVSPTQLKSKSDSQGEAPQPAVIPNWLDLAIPYSAWVDIFYYAAVSGGILDNGWLLRTATTCKAFSEPAITALYQSPSPRTSIKAKKLAALLERPPDETLFNYRTKVESMYIDIDKFPLALLPQSISPLRRLKELVIYTPLDQPPYRDLDKTIRWHYPQELFHALSHVGSEDQSISPVILKSWEWSSRLLGDGIDTIARIHQLPSFSQLTRLSFTNFQVPSLHKAAVKPDDEAGTLQLYQEDAETVEAVAAAISQLSSLKHLIFESSTVMNDRLLPLLPKHLLHLELINCWEVWSEDLSQFLRTHGHDLRALTLLHNQSLDLAFLTDLAETCPSLRQLHVNMSYYRHHDSIDDADPMYDQALLSTQLPLWPASLRLLAIDNVRQWSVEAAEVFLQSLVDSAPNLPNLRYLSIKTMLNIPWQKRAELRRVWTEKLEHVFLRVCDPPRPHGTLRAVANSDEVDATPPAKRRRKDPMTPSRRSGRIAANASDSDPNSSRPRRGRDSKPLYRDPDTDEDEEPEEEEEEEGEESVDPEKSPNESKAEKRQLPVQGMCETVIAKFDNQKVRELQYGMEDFDDDDESSGEEWNGDEEEDDPVFVWR